MYELYKGIYIIYHRHSVEVQRIYLEGFWVSVGVTGGLERRRGGGAGFAGSVGLVAVWEFIR
jgi:hypothetical protein